uniref:Fatty acyl-CoA reductase n=1 Tax=Macrostomum lignano TaxID=282301 RepID=A0A1I8F7C8_9PLAT
PILLYGMEAVPMTATRQQALDAHYRSLLRYALDVHYPNSVPTRDLMTRAGVPALSCTIRKRRQMLLGHCLRSHGRGEQNPLALALLHQPTERLRRGQGRTVTLNDMFLTDLQTIGLSPQSAMTCPSRLFCERVRANWYKALPCKQQLAMSLNLATESSEKNKLAGQPSFQSISEFYAGKNVLITGITGFLGKVLLEKLLWSCPQIGHIFALMRPKRGESIGARLDSLLASKLFDRLPGPTRLPGDLFEPNLGLSQKDVELLIRNVSIVFHSAATVRFDEHLKIAVQMNLEGPKKVAELCERMPHLEALVHVSTAYANCDRRVVEEAVYAPEVHPQKLLDAIEWMDDDVLEQVRDTPAYWARSQIPTPSRSSSPSFYLTDRFSHLPIVIVRPSIVGASWQEPLPGWVDNFNGPTGVFAAISKGLLRMMQGDVRCKADIIPVDIATNIIISSVWNFRLFSRQATVYNAGVGPGNRLTWGDVERITPEYFCVQPDPKRHPAAQGQLHHQTRCGATSTGCSITSCPPASWISGCTLVAAGL